MLGRVGDGVGLAAGDGVIASVTDGVMMVGIAGTDVPVLHAAKMAEPNRSVIPLDMARK